MADDIETSVDFPEDGKMDIDINFEANVSADSSSKGSSSGTKELSEALKQEFAKNNKSDSKKDVESQKNEKTVKDSLGKTLEEIKNTLVSLNTAAPNISKSVAASSASDSGVSTEKKPTAIPTSETNQVIAAFESKKFQTDYSNTLSQALKMTFSDSSVKDALAESLSKGAEENGSSSDNAGIADSGKSETLSANEDGLSSLVDKIKSVMEKGFESVSNGEQASGKELSDLSNEAQSLREEAMSTSELNTQSSDETVNALNKSLEEIKEDATKTKTTDAAASEAEDKGEAEVIQKIDKDISEASEEMPEIVEEATVKSKEINDFVLSDVAENIKVGGVELSEIITGFQALVDKVLADNASANGEAEDKFTDDAEKKPEFGPGTDKPFGPFPSRHINFYNGRRRQLWKSRAFEIYWTTFKKRASS